MKKAGDPARVSGFSVPGFSDQTSSARVSIYRVLIILRSWRTTEEAQSASPNPSWNDGSDDTPLLSLPHLQRISLTSGIHAHVGLVYWF